jgi:hypothetical protein
MLREACRAGKAALCRSWIGGTDGGRVREKCPPGAVSPQAAAGSPGGDARGAAQELGRDVGTVAPWRRSCAARLPSGR